MGVAHRRAILSNSNVFRLDLRLVKATRLIGYNSNYRRLRHAYQTRRLSFIILMSTKVDVRVPSRSARLQHLGRLAFRRFASACLRQFKPERLRYVDDRKVRRHKINRFHIILQLRRFSFGRVLDLRQRHRRHDRSRTRHRVCGLFRYLLLVSFSGTSSLSNYAIAVL